MALLDEFGNPIVASDVSTPPPVSTEADPVGGTVDRPEDLAGEGVADATPAPEPAKPDVVDPILKAMSEFQQAANNRDKDTMRAKLAEAVQGFSKLRGSKASLGKDYMIDIAEKAGPDGRPGLVVDLSETTTRGKTLIQDFQGWVKNMESQAREAQLRMTIQMLVASGQALENVVNQLLMRVSDLERKVNG